MMNHSRQFKPFVTSSVEKLSRDIIDWLNPLNGPDIIEIGCGVGWHPIQLATKDPNSKILAIERTSEKFNKFASRARAHNHLNNLFPAHADAAVLLPNVVAKDCVNQIYILYPNPYPKKKHQNLRLSFSPFTSFLSEILKPTGELIIATNEEFYAKEIGEILVKSFPFKLKNSRLLTKAHSPRTHFEKKYLAAGQTCFEVTLSPRK